MWVSKICPTFILLGTPSGFKTISTGLPFSIYGISSTGTILLMTPLFPCLPDILSPGLRRLFTATKTFTIFITLGNKSSPCLIFSTLSSNLSLISILTFLYCSINVKRLSFLELSFSDNLNKSLKFICSIFFSSIFSPGLKFSNCSFSAECLII